MRQKSYELSRQAGDLTGFISSALVTELEAFAGRADGYFRQWPAGDVSFELENWDIEAFSARLADGLLRGRWMSRTAEEVIAAAEAHIRTARFGLEDLKSHIPEKKTPGLLNVAVFGRSATFALQNLKSIIPEFEEWYKSKQDEFAADALLKYFNGLRRKIEHAAHAPKVNGVHIDYFDSTKSMKYFGAAPPNAVGRFIGDREGRSGWIVRSPDGATEHYYVDLPGVRPMITLDDAPVEGGPREKDAVCLAEIYLSKVEAVVAEAREKFVR